MANRYLITNNVLKEYDEYVIKERMMTIEPLWLREWIYKKMEVIDKTKKLEKETNPKKKFLDFVYLYDYEYDKLVEDYWEIKVKDLIARMNWYIGSKWDKYKSHYHTALNWFAQKWIQKISKKEEQKKIVEEMWKEVKISDEKKQEILDKMKLLKQGFKSL